MSARARLVTFFCLSGLATSPACVGDIGDPDERLLLEIDLRLGDDS